MIFRRSTVFGIAVVALAVALPSVTKGDKATSAEASVATYAVLRQPCGQCFEHPTLGNSHYFPYCGVEGDPRFVE